MPLSIVVICYSSQRRLVHEGRGTLRTAASSRSQIGPHDLAVTRKMMGGGKMEVVVQSLLVITERATSFLKDPSVALPTKYKPKAKKAKFPNFFFFCLWLIHCGGGR